MKTDRIHRSAPSEIELKLLLDPADVDTLRRHPLLEEYAAEAPHAQNIVNTYFDTPGLDIMRRGASLRLRQLDQDWVQTLKAGAKAEGGLHQRSEWETRVDGPALDPDELRARIGPRSQWGRLLHNPALLPRLAPIFSTRVKRTVWELRLPHGDEIEFALDQGVIECKDHKEPICEVELELKSGDAERLFEFALQLAETIPLRIGNFSKSERGYALVAPPDAPAGVKAGDVELTADMTVEQGFKAIAANCMAQVQGNESGVLHGSDPESVHQMRVGIRRLRSALGLFKDVLPVPQALRQELGWLASQLGAARDWDVLSASTLATLNGAAPQDVGVDALQAAASGIARGKREQAAAALQSSRYTALMLSFFKWLEGAGWRGELAPEDSKPLERPVKKFADKMLAHDQNRLLKRGRRLDAASPQVRHRVRIAAKKTRYATEFFHSLYPQKRVRGYVKTLSALQDELGLLNDAAIADGLLHELQEARHELARDVSFARGFLISRVNGDDRKLTRLWKRFEPLRPPCHK